MIEYDLRFLQAVFNWATISKQGGRILLEANPFKGFAPPTEKNPTRVVLSAEEYRRLRVVAGDVDWRFEVALVVAHETGHRIGAIRQLRWSDVDLSAGTIRWRATTDKSGHEHQTPITAQAVAAFEIARRESPGLGEAPVLPSPTDRMLPMSRHLARDHWKRGERLAGLEPKRGRGWHALRRKFASDLMYQPLKVLTDLGGWKTERTVLMCYQRPDEKQLREALAERRRMVR